VVIRESHRDKGEKNHCVYPLDGGKQGGTGEMVSIGGKDARTKLGKFLNQKKIRKIRKSSKKTEAVYIIKRIREGSERG